MGVHNQKSLEHWSSLKFRIFFLQVSSFLCISVCLVYWIMSGSLAARFRCFKEKSNTMWLLVFVKLKI